MKTINITPAGVMIDQARYLIPDRAKATLSKYANTRLKDLKLVTKAFKYTFPFFHGGVYARKSYTKFFEIIEKAIHLRIPYLSQAKVPFIQLTPTSTGTQSFRLLLGPVNTRRDAPEVVRYARYLSYLARKQGLPVMISCTNNTFLAVPDGQTTYTLSAEQRELNTYNIMTVHVDLLSSESQNGYLLLHYVEYVLKVVETLHRKAHYAESTFRANR